MRDLQDAEDSAAPPAGPPRPAATMEADLRALVATVRDGHLRALLHDLGKLEAYTAGPGPIDLTDAGRLHGEIALGYYRVRREIEAMPGFPPETAQAVLHIILSHHGSLAHGSPVVPATREATLVHMVDNLGGRLGSFDRLERALPAGEHWTPFDRGIGTSAYFGPAAPPEEREAA